MTKSTDHTLAVLKQIRDAVTQTNVRLDHTNERLDHLARLHTQTDIRVATELTAVLGAVHTVRDAVAVDRALRKTVDDHEQRLTAIERRTG